MSIELLERAARELTPFLDEVAFVGGATVVLWITDPAAAEPRPTKDVDLVVEVASRLAWHDFEARLRAHGLRPDMSSPVICRWRAGKGDELLLDVMPSDATLLGFENRWQRPALDHAVTCSLPSGRSIRAISPPYLVATKLEAWKGRGRGDHLRSHDLEDIIGLVDGRASSSTRSSPHLTICVHFCHVRSALCSSSPGSSTRLTEPLSDSAAVVDLATRTVWRTSCCLASVVLPAADRPPWQRALDW
jgi:hypothetical protein